MIEKKDNAGYVSYMKKGHIGLPETSDILSIEPALSQICQQCSVPGCVQGISQHGNI